MGSYDSPYEEFDGLGQILIEEYGSDGFVITSEMISISGGISTKSIEIFAYKKDNSIFYKSIEPRKTYYITVKNALDDGTTSVGKRVKHVTRSYVKPEAPYNLEITQNLDYSLSINFLNSQSIFANNYIRIKQKLNNVQTTIFDYKNIGKANFLFIG
jgi:hypothetical protein